jgi:hypothetical protein
MGTKKTCENLETNSLLFLVSVSCHVGCGASSGGGDRLSPFNPKDVRGSELRIKLVQADLFTIDLRKQPHK